MTPLLLLDVVCEQKFMTHMIAIFQHSLRITSIIITYIYGEAETHTLVSYTVFLTRFLKNTKKSTRLCKWAPLIKKAIASFKKSVVKVVIYVTEAAFLFVDNLVLLYHGGVFSTILPIQRYKYAISFAASFLKYCYYRRKYYTVSNTHPKKQILSIECYIVLIKMVVAFYKLKIFDMYYYIPSLSIKFASIFMNWCSIFNIAFRCRYHAHSKSLKQKAS